MTFNYYYFFIKTLQKNKPELRNVWNCRYLFGMRVLPEWQKWHSNEKNVSSSVPEIHSKLVAQTFTSEQTATIYLTTCYLPESTSAWNYLWQISYRATETQNIYKATGNAGRFYSVQSIDLIPGREAGNRFSRNTVYFLIKKSIALFQSDG